MLQPLQVSVAFSQLELLPNAGEEDISNERFGDIIVRTGLEGSRKADLFTLRGDDYNRKLLARVLVSNLTKGFDAIHSWHHDVEEHQRWRRSQQTALDTFNAVADFFN